MCGQGMLWAGGRAVMSGEGVAVLYQSSGFKAKLDSGCGLAAVV
jgi:hypothetical protein